MLFSHIIWVFWIEGLGLVFGESSMRAASVSEVRANLRQGQEALCFPSALPMVRPLHVASPRIAPAKRGRCRKQENLSCSQLHPLRRKRQKSCQNKPSNSRQLELSHPPGMGRGGFHLVPLPHLMHHLSCGRDVV